MGANVGIFVTRLAKRVHKKWPAHVISFFPKCNQITKLTLLIILLTKNSRINLVGETKILYLCTTRFLGDNKYGILW